MFRQISKKINGTLVRITAVLGYVLFVAGTAGHAWGEEKGFTDVMNESGTYSCLSSQEAELLALVNSYRNSHSLPSITNSRSLNKVARIHVLDLYNNSPHEETDIHGEKCNLHSWSYKGFWTPVCYKKGSHNPEAMWYKAKEITSYVYTAAVYENAYFITPIDASPDRALASWKKSPTHNALILETGIWKGLNIKAIGIGMYKGFAVMWVGDAVDSAGPMDACSIQEK